MKRLFVILLILVLPLQFSFAAAASYCEDDIAPVSQHYGHHDHESEQQPVKADPDVKQTDHAECGVCHLGCAKLLNAPLTLGLLSSELPLHVPVLLSAAQFQPAPLQRPPIASLA